HQVRDTRLRCAVASPQGPRPDLARPDAACDELAPLWRVPEDRPHDLAFGLSPARLFAPRPRRHRRRDGRGLPRAAAAGPLRRGIAALAGTVRLAGDGAHLPADVALLSPVAAVGT